ncbi:MAG: PDZ domain-containing protein, partial [Clostridia bacterium]|nr:PDZ domain-containing protein [Clostridia bacterium]
KAAGLKPGDLITAVNGRIITENRDLRAALSECAGVKTELRVNRNGQELTLTVTPEKGLKGEVKIGASVRDSMAGIGTVTYFDPEASTFGSLGHGICQSENGCLFPVGSGCLVPSTVVGVNRGTEGEPGELLGEFEGDKNSGNLTGNTVSGLFGEIEKDSAFFLNGDEKAIPVGEGIKKGKAYIMSNIYDKEVNLYEIEVVKIVNSERETRNFIIRVTDTVLLEATGGIVQGMSGSPIIQNGKLVGAVTHVLVNDPTMGYGILIENMLNSDPAYAEQNAA